MENAVAYKFMRRMVRISFRRNELLKDRKGLNIYQTLSYRQFFFACSLREDGGDYSKGNSPVEDTIFIHGLTKPIGEHTENFI